MDFLSFSHDYWDSPRSNRQCFCEALAESNRVLFCGPPFYLPRLIRQAGRGTLTRSGVRRIRPNLVSYTPSKLLFRNYRFPRVDHFMTQRRHARIRSLMRREGFEKPVLLIWNPELLNLLGQFGESLVVYYIYDQYSGYTGGSGRPDPREIELLQRADVVFAVSEELRRSKEEWAPDIHLLPNAVDFDYFSSSRDEGTRVPPDLCEVPQPRIGYVGTINEKLNLPVLTHLASTHPDWSLVLVGRENYTVEAERNRFLALTARPNVHWLGHRPYEKIPAYLKGLDICLMCYVINGWTYYGDPLKMHEYLASGKPTVAADLTSIRPFSDVVSIPESLDGWVRAVREGLYHDSEAARSRRIDTARRNSYRARIAEATTVLSSALVARGQGILR